MIFDFDFYVIGSGFIIPVDHIFLIKGCYNVVMLCKPAINSNKNLIGVKTLGNLNWKFPDVQCKNDVA